MKSVVPLLTVLAVIAAVWYGFAIWMNSLRIRTRLAEDTVV